MDNIEFDISKIIITERDLKLEFSYKAYRPGLPLLQEFYDFFTFEKKLPRKVKKFMKQKFELGNYTFIPFKGFGDFCHNNKVDRVERDLASIIPEKIKRCLCRTRKD